LKPAKTPAQQARAIVFGNITRSDVPNHAPWSKRCNHRPTTRIPSQAGFENPSTGAAPRWSTGPAPVAIYRAYANGMPASSAIKLP
jgi:hypothetical protein